MRKKAATERRTRARQRGKKALLRQGPPTWDGPSRVWWGLREGKPNKRPPSPLPDFLRPLFGAKAEDAAVDNKQRIGIPPGGGRRLSLKVHPGTRERWHTMRRQVAAARTPASDERLDQTTDFLLTTKLGHEAAIRAARRVPRSSAIKRYKRYRKHFGWPEIANDNSAYGSRRRGGMDCPALA